MTGKKWFYWLGKLHGSRRLTRATKYGWPEWVFDAYMDGWWCGFNETSI